MTSPVISKSDCGGETEHIALYVLGETTPPSAALRAGIGRKNAIMISKYVKGKVAVFIDAANILYSQQTLGWRIDYQKLKIYFKRECELVGLYFYTGKIGKDHKQAKFLQRMKEYGYKVTSKEVKMIRVSPDTYERKGDLDAELIIDALKNINNFDTCILMSGDSDFAALLDELKRQGKWVIVMSTKGHISRELIERAKYINLKKLKEEIAMP